MEARERFKVEKYGGDYCDFEESNAVSDAFELLNLNDFPENQRNIVEEFNRRAEIGNQRHRVAMYRAEMFEKGFNAGMYICTFDRDENMTSFVFTDETRRLLGYDGLEDLPNEFDSWVKTLLPEQRDIMVPIFWSTVKNHRQLPDISHAEYPMVRKDGRIIWVTGAGRFIRREDGSLEIYMGCYRDVTAEHEKDDYLHIIEGIGRVFNFSLYIDMSNETYKVVSTNEYVEKVQKDPNAFQFLRDNVDSSVHPDYRDEMKAWLQPEVISKLLKEKDTISKDFFSSEAEMWFRGIFMVGDKNEDGSLAHIIYGCQDITYEKRKELDQQAQLKKIAEDEEAQLEKITELNKSLQQEQKAKDRERIIVDALSASYLNVYVINIAEQMVEILKLNGYVTSGLSKEKAGPYPYEATCRTYISNRVYDEDQQTVADCMSLDNLLLQLKNKKEYEFTYRVPENGGISYYQGKYVMVGEGYIVCGFQNIDEIVKKEKEQKEELEAAKEAAEKRSKELKDKLDIIGGLTNAVIVCSAYNTITKEVIHVKELPEVHDLLKSCCSPQEAFDTFLSVGVAAEDLSVMKEFVDINTVPERLKDRDVVSAEFRKMFPKQGWNRASWIVADRDEQGNAYKFLYIVEEITDSVLERKKQEAELKQARDEAQAANAAKTSFLFNMSHDIRTPMNAIMGFRDLLEKYQEDPEKRRNYLSKIQDSSTVLLSIINNVLEMARIEKGTLEIEETAWSTEQFNDTLYSVFNVMMAEKGLDFTRQIEVQHHYVYCDPTKLREIFINILSNAYKYTNAGGSVNMHLEEIPSEREGWVLYQTTVSDTGIGMSEEFQPHIFEEFSREQNTTDAKVEGTGLGMPIVKRLVEMLDGTIEVKSKKGEGSTFIVTIPHRIADKTNLVDHAGVQIDPKLFEGKHILLAEDNDLNAEIAMEILDETGFIVDRAEDGAVCVDMLKKAEDGCYDLILMDIQMPNMNGYEATKAIRQLEDHDKANIKILAMTANAFEEDRREAFRAGMNGHLAKPINVKELMKTLAGILG